MHIVISNKSKRMPPQSVRPKLQVVAGQDPSPSPTTPSVSRFIPRRDRETMAYAFFTLGKSLYWLARTNRLAHRDVELILREQHQELMDRNADAMERILRVQVTRRAA